MSYRCPLGSLIPVKKDPADLEKIKRDGWRDQRILVVSPDDPRLDWTQKKMIENLANFLYGAKNES